MSTTATAEMTLADHLQDQENHLEKAHGWKAHYVDIAKACYEANRAYAESIGDTSFGPWDEAPDWQKLTNIRGVLFKLANPSATPEQMHDSWCEAKLADGWMYGPVKDADKKQHPCLVGYPSLPKEQRFKDSLFSAIVLALKGV